MIPRIQGKVGVIEDPPELKGKWTFQIWISEMGSGDPGEPIFTGPALDTEEKAKYELRRAVDFVVKEIEKHHGLPPTGTFINLKTNTMGKFEDEA